MCNLIRRSYINSFLYFGEIIKMSIPPGHLRFQSILYQNSFLYYRSKIKTYLESIKKLISFFLITKQLYRLVGVFFFFL